MPPHGEHPTTEERRADVPLMELEEPWIFGMWPRRLLVFEDRIEVRDFELLREKALSWRYDQIDGAVASGAERFANLLVTVRGGGPVLMRGLSKDVAESARALIEDRTSQAENGPSYVSSPSTADPERLLRALADLRGAGVLSEREFEAKRALVTARLEYTPDSRGWGRKPRGS